MLGGPLKKKKKKTSTFVLIASECALNDVNVGYDH
jgi:hypothetical protein